jgi:hypothetical protein
MLLLSLFIIMSENNKVISSNNNIDCFNFKFHYIINKLIVLYYEYKMAFIIQINVVSRNYI